MFYRKYLLNTTYFQQQMEVNLFYFFKTFQMESCHKSLSPKTCDSNSVGF